MRLTIIGILALALTACGEVVEVPPAHVGKVLTKAGYLPDSIPPSKFRLEMCFAYCDKLYLVEVSDVGVEEEFRLFMPKDQLNVAFDLRATMAIRGDETQVNTILNNIPTSPPSDGSDHHGVIRFGQVYDVYGRPIVREVVRSVMAEYSINDVASNRESVSAEISEALAAALKTTPLRLIRSGLADVQFPAIITEAKELAAERREAIKQEEAKKQIALVQLQTELETARMRRNIEKEKAQAALEQNLIIAESVTPEWLEYRKLEVLEQMATNQNTVFVPMEAIGTLGLENRVFRDAKAN